MSRVKIGAVVAVIVAILTGAAYVLATRRLEAQIAHDVEARVSRAEELLTQIGAVESLNLITRAQELARAELPGKALTATDEKERKATGQGAVQHFLDGLGTSTPHPDFTALVDAKGAVVAADSPLPDSEDLKSRFKSVAAAIDNGQVSKDVWAYGKSTFKVGVAPVVAPGGSDRVGAVILGYALSNKEALDHARKLGSEVVVFRADKVVATSFARSVISDLNVDPRLAALAQAAISGKKTDPVTVELGGDTYIADAGPLPLNFDDRQSGAMVLESLASALEPVTTVRVTIAILGLAALLVALLTMFVTSRLILHQSEEIELGVNEIINGDADYSFKPVGSDMDGLANALNVMLARLLGRPEPGEEPMDEGTGATGKVLLDEEATAPPGARMSNDPEIVALASEPEAQYYKRLYDEYLAARRATGESVEGIGFESFGAKLRLNEANLKKKYNCKAVRFRVVTKGNQVTLKPVPIL
jgi:hypothetical protein